MEVLQVAEQIEKIIEALKVEGKCSEKLIETKAKTAADYDRAMGIKTAALKISGQPATLIKDLARGEAANNLYAKIVGESSLKAHFERMENLRSQMNGYQSINKYLDST